MLTFKMTQAEYDTNFANMTFNGEKTKIEIIDDDENIVKTINVSTGGVATQATMVNAYNCIGDLKMSIRADDHNGWYKCGDIQRTMTDVCWGAITASSLDTIWTATFGSKIIPSASGRVLGISGSGQGLTPRASGEVMGTETHILDKTEIPPHLHSMPVGHGHDDSNFNCDYLVSAADNAPAGTFNENHKTDNTGGGQAHNNMQPTIFAGYLFVYLGA